MNVNETIEDRVVHDGFTTLFRRSGGPDLPAILLIHGSGPGATGWSNWQYLMPELRRLGGPVQAHFYNRSSHWTQVEHKDSFNTLIAEFFGGQI